MQIDSLYNYIEKTGRFGEIVTVCSIGLVSYQQLLLEILYFYFLCFG